jgi:hypothetical protein
MAISNELHSQGFIVAWYDRFKPKKTTEQGMLNDKNFAETFIYDAADELLSIPYLNGNEIKANQPEGKHQDLVVLQQVEIKEKPVSSKNKYSCSCGENLWAKTTLQAVCKKCNTDFVIVKN